MNRTELMAYLSAKPSFHSFDDLPTPACFEQNVGAETKSSSVTVHLMGSQVLFLGVARYEKMIFFFVNFLHLASAQKLHAFTQ